MNKSKKSRIACKEKGLVFSVVVPVYNSERTLMELYKRLMNVMEALDEPFEFIFVEDCGIDCSWQLLQEIAAEDPRVTALQLMHNSGQGNATLAGIGISKGEYIITLDDDLQHPPEELPEMIQALRENDGVDVVIGAPRQKHHGLVRHLGSTFINRMNSWFLHKDPSLRFTSFRVMRRQIANFIIGLRTPYPALGPMLISITHRIINITVRHEPRREGKSAYQFRQIVKQTLSNFIGYSILPLHLLASIGLLGILVTFLLGSYFIIRYFTVGISVSGWTSLLLVLLALSGFNFFAFAVLGEYILRINQISSNISKCLVRNCVKREECMGEEKAAVLGAER
jgi:polyisoprenyl-phosphate glycosyltransferase